MNIEDVIAAIDETYRRTGGRMPVRLICGRKLFQTLCDEAKIEYDVGNVMTAKFYGIPITVVHNTELIEDDKIIVVPENWNGTGQTTGTTGYCYDWWNLPTYWERDPYYPQPWNPAFQTRHLGTPMKDSMDDINISEEEFLKILNGGD